MNYILKSKFILLILFSGSIFSQNDLFNHQKYWYYKTRLNNDFVKVGVGPGESMPYNQRGKDQKGYPLPPDISGGRFGNVNMLLGDGPSTLGVYIAALATEYGLLKNSGQNTDSVKHELFCALNAINRIDDITEPLFSGGQSVPLNGFFIRDDVPGDFLIKNYDHFNYYNTWKGSYMSWGPTIPDTYETDRGFVSQILNAQFGSESAYSKIQGGASPHAHDMSQDHVITLLIGLSLINKYVDYSANDNGEVFPYEGLGVSSIKQEAWNIVDRLAQHFKNDPLYNLRNPVTGTIVTPGGNTAFTQYGLAESFCKSEGFTTGPSSPFVPILNGYGSLVPFTCNYNTPYVRTGGLVAWGTFLSTPSTSLDNAGFKAHLLATGNCGWVPAPVNVASSVCNWVSNNICNNFPWPINTICNWVNQLICNTIMIPVPGFKNETPFLIDITANEHYGIEGLKENQVRNYDFWDAPLLHRALFPSSTSPNYLPYLPIVKTMLNNAPCVGPYNFGQFARPDFEWTCENRIEKTTNRQDFNEPDLGWMAGGGHTFEKGIFKGEYNGTDYMLYHNLYRLTSFTGASGYQDLSHRYINITLPIGSLCAKPNTCLFRAFETIVADNTINSNGAVEYKAGKIIDLKPGFYVRSGADFHAYIQAANCSGGSAGLRTVHDTTNSENNSFDGYDNMGDDVLTHYVNYPQEKDSVRENLTEGILPASITENLTENTETKAQLINETVNDNYFIIYPNPADQITNIEFSLTEGEIATLYIINTNGATISQNEMPKERFHKLQLNVSSLSKGLYLLRLVTNNNRVEKKTLTVQ